MPDLTAEGLESHRLVSAPKRLSYDGYDGNIEDVWRTRVCCLSRINRIP